jgi:hypothetical protein
MRISIADVTRPDTSASDLRRFQSLGYKTVVFIANYDADPDCDRYDGDIYSIDELLALDSPIFRISHPNCRCKFEPYGRKEEELQTTSPEPEAPTTLTEEPEVEEQEEFGPPEVQAPENPQEVKKKDPWYRRFMPWLFKNKQSRLNRARILRAYDEK